MMTPGHKYIFVNGPRGAGKDYVGTILRKCIDARPYKMTNPMDKGIKAFFDIPDRHWKYLREEGKTAPTDYLFGLSMVETLISMSEEWAKEKFGQQVFGHLAVHHFRNNATSKQFTVITDCGFKEEMLPIVGNAGIRNCVVVQVHREGHSFDSDTNAYGDARQYINGEDFGVKTVKIENRKHPNVPKELQSTVFAIEVVASILDVFDMPLPFHMRADSFRYEG